MAYSLFISGGVDGLILSEIGSLIFADVETMDVDAARLRIVPVFADLSSINAM
jgi:hypothetical protein